MYKTGSTTCIAVLSSRVGVASAVIFGQFQHCRLVIVRSYTCSFMFMFCNRGFEFELYLNTVSCGIRIELFGYRDIYPSYS